MCKCVSRAKKTKYQENIFPNTQSHTHKCHFQNIKKNTSAARSIEISLKLIYKNLFLEKELFSSKSGFLSHF